MEMAARQNAGGNWTSGNNAPDGHDFLLSSRKPRRTASVKVSGSPKILSRRLVSVSGDVKSLSGSVVRLPVDRKTQSDHSVALSGEVISLPGNAVLLPEDVISLPVNTISFSGNIVLLPGNTISLSGNTVSITGNAILLTGNAISLTGKPITIRIESKTVQNNQNCPKSAIFTLFYGFSTIGLGLRCLRPNLRRLRAKSGGTHRRILPATHSIQSQTPKPQNQ
jgi:hypothetical protein